MAFLFLRKLTLTLHRCLALAFGLFFVLMGLTGSCNVFYKELDTWLHPALHVSPAAAPPQSLDVILAVVQETYPHEVGSWHVELPHHPTQPITVWHYEPQEKSGEFFAALMVSVHPYTADILWSRFWGDTWLTWIYDLHWTLMLGELGHHLVGILGLVLLLALGSGLFLWWPSWGKMTAAFRIKKDASASRQRYDRHRVTGLYTLLFLGIMGVSGFYLVYPAHLNPVDNLWTRHAPDAASYTSTPLLQSSPLPLTQAVTIAQRQFPQANIRWLSTPADATGVYAIQLQQPGDRNATYPGTFVWIDQYSGAILGLQDSTQFTLGKHFLHLQYPLHNGELLGRPGRLFIFILGFIPLTLYVTGILIWWKRRHRLSPRPPTSR